MTPGILQRVNICPGWFLIHVSCVLIGVDVQWPVWMSCSMYNNQVQQLTRENHDCLRELLVILSKVLHEKWNDSWTSENVLPLLLLYDQHLCDHLQEHNSWNGYTCTVQNVNGRTFPCSANTSLPTSLKSWCAIHYEVKWSVRPTWCKKYDLLINHSTISSTCFGHHYAHLQEHKAVYTSIWFSVLYVLAGVLGSTVCTV